MNLADQLKLPEGKTLEFKRDLFTPEGSLQVEVHPELRSRGDPAGRSCLSLEPACTPRDRIPRCARPSYTKGINLHSFRCARYL
jgi:hypothetical protein